jgi:hypothetical protein
MDGPGWLRALDDYAAPAGVLRAAQLSRIRGFQPPTWAAHFAKVDPFLANLDPERLLA